MRQRKNKKIVIQTPPLVYNYEQELRQRNLKNDTRIANLINPPNDIKCVQSVKRENTTPNTRKRVKNRTLPKK